MQQQATSTRCFNLCKPFRFILLKTLQIIFPVSCSVKKTCPRQISDTIPNVTSSLRNIWLLSKCFNTDLKIHNLILMISQLINERVVNAIQLIEFKNPSSLQVDIGLVFCLQILSGGSEELRHSAGEVEEEFLEDSDGNRVVS